MSQVIGRCRWRRVLTAAVLFGTPAVACGGGTVFVDPAAPAGGQGESWATAYRSLQDALAVVRESEDVVAMHVAQGTYAPDEGESVITGDRRASFRLISGVSILGGFAGVNEADPDARDVVRFRSVLTGDLDRNDGPGFTGIEENSHHVVAVTNGSDEAVLDGFTIRGGNADGPAPDERGGGIMINGGEPVLRGIVFEDNSAFFGGALFVDRGAPVLDTIRFEDNRATFGGALYADRSPATVIASEIIGGDALAGGGVYVSGGAPTFDACRFTENDADLDGGAVYASGAAVDFTGCEFRVNTATFDGGAVYAVAGALSLDTCVLVTNFADEGGGLRCVGGTPTLDDTTFSLNFARRGGAMNTSGGDAVARNCVFDRNESQAGGGVLTEDGAPSFIACTFDRNESIEGGGFHGTGGTPTLDACDFTANEGGQRGGAILMAMGAADIRDCTFAENTARGFFISNGGAVDLIEATGTSIARCVFDANLANFGGGLAVSGDATIVDCDFNDHPGFVGGALYLAEGAPVIERCNFRRNSAEGDVVAAGGAIHAFLADPVLIGCLFEANTASRTGGAVHVEDGSPVVTDCRFLDNTSVDDGGGLYVVAGTPIVTRSIFRGNASTGFGGGVAAEEADGMYVDCVFAGNRGAFGGGMVSFSGSPQFANCVFTGNTATGIVGKAGCTGAGLGGGLASLVGAPTVVNCTFATNTADCGGSGGGVSMILGAIRNCVLWENADGGGTDESAQVSGALVTVDYSCVQGLTGDLGGTGNIGTDPRLVDRLGPDGTAGTADDDLRLAAGSPSIDAGDNAAVPGGVTMDIAGRSRFVDDPDTIDTGAGEAPIVDLGAHEYQASVCAADVDGDGVVGFGDVLLMLAAWGPCPPKGACPGDISGNGAVDFADILLVLGQWGACR